MTPTLIRISERIVSWNSASFKVGTYPIGGVVACNYEHRRSRKMVRSNVPGARPLGRPTGLYSVPTFVLRILKEDAYAFDAYLASTVELGIAGDLSSLGNGSIADTVFDFSVQCVEEDLEAGFGDVTLSAVGTNCVIESKHSTYDEGIDALVEEYHFSCLQLTEKDANGVRYLYSTAHNALDSLAQDYVTIGGDRSPGKASIIDLKRTIGWDVRQAYGLDRATLVPKGNPPATFSIRFDLWDPGDLNAWDTFSKTYLKWALFRAPGAITKALTIVHPTLQAQPIALKECVVSQIHGLNKDEEGLWSCTVDFMEYGPPAIALQKAPSAIAGKSVDKPVATTAAEQKIQSLQAADEAAMKKHALAITALGGS